jgi:hypothetical protein
VPTVNGSQWNQYFTVAKSQTLGAQRQSSPATAMFRLGWRLILFGQAPIIAFLTSLVVVKDSPRDFAYFMLALVAVWFGASVSAREIIRERAVYSRERMVNLGLLPYIGSKLWVLARIVGLQCILLFATLKLFDLTGIMKMPGEFYGLPQLAVMIMTGRGTTMPHSCAWQVASGIPLNSATTTTAFELWQLCGLSSPLPFFPWRARETFCDEELSKTSLPSKRSIQGRYWPWRGSNSALENLRLMKMPLGE